MFQGIDEDLIIEHALVISFFFFFDLLQEEFFLDKGIIEFGISITELMIFDEEFKSFGESWFGSMIFGERRHNLGMLNDESRI